MKMRFQWTKILRIAILYEQSKFFQLIEEPNRSNPLGSSISWKSFSLRTHRFEAKLRGFSHYYYEFFSY
jgi:hypothetical protein